MTIDVLSRTDSFRFRVLEYKKEMIRILHFSRQKNYDIISSILLRKGSVLGMQLRGGALEISLIVPFFFLNVMNIFIMNLQKLGY